MEALVTIAFFVLIWFGIAKLAQWLGADKWKLP